MGSAALIYDDVAETLTFAVLFSDLTGPLILAHIHDGDASGLLTGVANVDPSIVDDLLNEGLYFNLHTALNMPGEIRGQIQNATTQVPEPAFGMLLLLGGLALRRARA